LRSGFWSQKPTNVLKKGRAIDPGNSSMVEGLTFFGLVEKQSKEQGECLINAFPSGGANEGGGGERETKKGRDRQTAPKLKKKPKTARKKKKKV